MLDSHFGDVNIGTIGQLGHARLMAFFCAVWPISEFWMLVKSHMAVETSDPNWEELQIFCSSSYYLNRVQWSSMI